MKHLKEFINNQIAKTYQNGVTTVDLYELTGAFKLAQNLLGDTWLEFLGEEHIVIGWLCSYYHNRPYERDDNYKTAREMHSAIYAYLRDNGYNVAL